MTHIEPPSMDLKDYQTHVKGMFDADSELKFSNGEKGHALVILVEFFQRAEKEVLIFCKDLDKDVYDKPAILDAMEQALKKGVSVSVIVQKEPQAKNFLTHGKMLHEDLNVEGKFRCIDGAQVDRVEFNFAVMDGKAVRLEPDKSKPEALACANWREFGERLSRQFKVLFSELEGSEATA